MLYTEMGIWDHTYLNRFLSYFEYEGIGRVILLRGLFCYNILANLPQKTEKADILSIAPPRNERFSLMGLFHVVIWEISNVTVDHVLNYFDKKKNSIFTLLK